MKALLIGLCAIGAASILFWIVFLSPESKKVTPSAVELPPWLRKDFPNIERRQPEYRTTMEEIANELETLVKGTVMFNPPDKMKLGEKQEMEVRILQGADLALTQKLRGMGVVESHEIMVASLMSVKLDGDDAFRINTHGIPEDQFVEKSGFTSWPFEVTALKKGEQNLYLCVGVLIKLRGDLPQKKFQPIYVKTILVEVNVPFSLGSFLAANWQWMGTVIFTPIIMAIVRIWWRRREKRYEARIIPATKTDISDIQAKR